jgi:hypothetical protein
VGVHLVGANKRNERKKPSPGLRSETKQKRYDVANGDFDRREKTKEKKSNKEFLKTIKIFDFYLYLWQDKGLRRYGKVSSFGYLQLVVFQLSKH